MTARSARMVAVAMAVALAGAAAVGACSTRSPQGVARKAVPLLDDGKRQEITALWTQIRQWRLDARLDVEPAPEQVQAMSTLGATAAAETCPLPPPAAGTCRDVCELGDAICENAMAICRLADELAGDAWAQDKCASAKASCREAEERCCGCQRPAVGQP